MAYRRWAFEILKALKSLPGSGYELAGVVTTETCEVNALDYAVDMPLVVLKLSEIKDGNYIAKVAGLRPDIILMYGWSWLVSARFLETATCIGLHPSPLPRYRGGSPIQNQIIAGEKESAVSLFKVTEGTDDGPVYAQEIFSLEGELDDIFRRITDTGSRLTRQMMDGLAKGTLEPVPQDESKKTTCKRRKPSDSEITPEELNTKPAEYIYNKIRALQDPYPNAYITDKDGKKVYLTKAHL